jgi:hypothetical protein
LFHNLQGLIASVNIQYERVDVRLREEGRLASKEKAALGFKQIVDYVIENRRDEFLMRLTRTEILTSNLPFFGTSVKKRVNQKKLRTVN